MFFLKGNKKVSITGLGGLDRVGGANCYLLETPESKIMIDCGRALVTLNEELWAENEVDFDYPNFGKIARKEIDLVLLTHSHLDHIGALPELIKNQSQQRLQMASRDLTLRVVR